jgi:hypothetical protein
VSSSLTFLTIQCLTSSCLDERRPDKPKAVGSNPTSGTNYAGASKVRGVIANEAMVGSIPIARSNMPRPKDGRRPSKPTI